MQQNVCLNHWYTNNILLLSAVTDSIPYYTATSQGISLWPKNWALTSFNLCLHLYLSLPIQSLRLCCPMFLFLLDGFLVSLLGGTNNFIILCEKLCYRTIYHKTTKLNMNPAELSLSNNNVDLNKKRVKHFMYKFGHKNNNRSQLKR